MPAPNEAQEPPLRPRILLVGCSADKDLAGIVAPLAPIADGVVLTQAHHYRAVAPEEMALLWQHHSAPSTLSPSSTDRALGAASSQATPGSVEGVPVEVVPEVASALRRARAWAGPAGLVCACGSFFVVAEVREALGLAVREPWLEPVGGDKAKRR